MAKAIIAYKKIPGIESIDPAIYRNNQFSQKMDFDVFRRILLRARRVNHGTYEFTVNGITYHARLIRSMEKWERAYYANSPETCITELMNVYP
jgi:hypothetical protein